MHAYQEIINIIHELNNNPVSEYGVQGLFSLGLSYFETMLTDQLAAIIKFFPHKIGLLKNKYSMERDSKLTYTSDQLFNGEMVKRIIESQVTRLGYANLETVIETYLSVFSIKSDLLTRSLDQVIEIKETRNLLLHNNLIVNELYLTKTKSIKRCDKMGVKLTIQQAYAVSSLKLISAIISDIIEKIRAKYGKYNILRLIKDLWLFSFESGIIKIESFCHLNELADIYDGPFTLSDNCSSSELFFLEFWQAQRTSTSITTPSLVRLDSRNIRKLAFLTEVFGELRFPHWSQASFMQ